MPSLLPTLTDAAPTAAERDAIFARRMEHASVHARPSMWLALPASLVTCAVLAGHVPLRNITGWFAVVVATYAARAAGVASFARVSPAASARDHVRWAWITAGLSIPTGAAWSLLPLWAAAPAGELRLVAVIVIIAVAAVAMRGLSSLWGTYAAFVLSTLAPVAFASLVDGAGAERALGIATSVYIAAILLVARQAEREFVHKTLLELRMRTLLVRLDAARAAAEVANAAKSQFIANVSHELRTPLQGILGLTEVLLGAPLGSTEKGYAEVIHRSGRGLLRILNDLLDFSKIEAGKLELERAPLDVRAVVRGVVELYSASANAKRLELSATVDDDVPTAVVGDADRLAEVLGNLVNNALKFTDRGGVRIAVRAPAEGRLRFSVRDSGIGLSSDEQRRVFDPFTQADSTTTRRYGGTGLGLSIVKHLVELHGGSLGVDSEPGAGAVFWFELPLEATAIEPEAAEPDAALSSPADVGPSGVSALPAGTGDVLVVEDNEVNRLVIRTVLGSLGATFRVAVDGVEAVQAFTERAPALILMDSQMPRMGGRDATVEIRRIEAARGGVRTPIVALTAGAAAGDREACLAAGMDDFLPKPFKVGDLRTCVLRWLDRAR